ncbi:MAG: zf-HC2 domain-containing protein [Pseudomonadales bacterium]|nr:zf-HC2 domain-containing protein [Pseudomonadales bacterium]
MSCNETAHIVAARFDDSLSPRQRRLLDEHVAACAECRDALADTQASAAQLRQWQEVPVPQWQRVPEGLREKQRASRPRFSFWTQWLPLATACMLALAVVLNVQVQIGGNGVQMAFGGSTQAQDISAQLAQFEQEQRTAQQQAMQQLAVQLEERQTTANLRLMETMVEQFGESTTRSMEQVLAYFEAQRQEDLQLLESSYQRLADSDFQTIRSVQQLANYVQYQGGQLQ